METHITNFGVKNFRVFEEMQEFFFAPITILTGTNSSGKSTLTKAIMVLKESMNKTKLSKLDLNIPYLKIGGFTKNLNKVEKENMYFRIEYNEHKSRQDRDLKIKFKSQEVKKASLFLGYDKDGVFNSEYRFNGELVFSWENKRKVSYDKIEDAVKWKIVSPEIKYHKDCIERLTTSLGSILMKKLIGEIECYIQEKVCCNGPDINKRDFFIILDILKESIRSVIDDSIEFFFYDEDGLLHSGLQAELPSVKDMVSSEFQIKLSSEIEQLHANEIISHIEIPNLNSESIGPFLDQIHYIGGVRAKQEIVFTIEEYPLLFEVLNNYLIYVQGGSEISMVMYLQNAINSYERGKYSFLEKWLVNEFKIVKRMEDLILNPIEGYGFIVKVNSEMSLNQVGYGFTQILPLILEIVFLEKNVFIIEEPESNLHPALQSKLANFFVEAAKIFDIQFVIETHSEYLIRKLQYLTAKKEIKPEDTQIYYFYPPNEVPEGEKQVYPINIMEDGSLTKNFGKGFFDEAGNLDLLLYQMTKTRSN